MIEAVFKHTILLLQPPKTVLSPQIVYLSMYLSCGKGGHHPAADFEQARICDLLQLSHGKHFYQDATKLTVLAFPEFQTSVNALFHLLAIATSIQVCLFSLLLKLTSQVTGLVQLNLPQATLFVREAWYRAVRADRVIFSTRVVLSLILDRSEDHPIRVCPSLLL